LQYLIEEAIHASILSILSSPAESVSQIHFILMCLKSLVSSAYKYKSESDPQSQYSTKSLIYVYYKHNGSKIVAGSVIVFKCLSLDSGLTNKFLMHTFVNYRNRTSQNWRLILKSE